MAVLISETEVLDVIDKVGAILFDYEAMLDAIDANGGNPIEFSFDTRKHFLAEYTMLVFGLQLEIACFPLSTAAVYFPPP